MNSYPCSLDGVFYVEEVGEPKQVEDLHLQAFYDSAKWDIYTYSCDRLYMPKSDTSLSIPFGDLELDFYSMAMSHDTLILSFAFADKGKPILASMDRKSMLPFSGVVFDTATKQKLFMVGTKRNYMRGRSGLLFPDSVFKAIN